MEKNSLYIVLAAIASLVAALIISGYVVNNRNYSMMNMMGMGRGGAYMMQADQYSATGMQGMNMGMSMGEMSSTLATLKGDDFDRMFITLMIEHHQGAIDMANLVLSNSEKEELKDLANDIIIAQTKEIEMMKSWLDSWY